MRAWAIKYRGRIEVGTVGIAKWGLSGMAVAHAYGRGRHEVVRVTVTEATPKPKKKTRRP